MLTLEQLKARKEGLGGSDIPILFGHSTYDEALGRKKSIVDLYFEKIDEDIIESNALINQRAYAGIKLEPVIKEMFEERTGKKATIYKDTFIHPEYKFIRGTIDAYIEDEAAVVDFKNVAPDQAKHWGDIGTDILPIKYMLQMAQYCEILTKVFKKPVNKAYVVPLISGYDLRVYEYKHKESIAKGIISKASWFWNEHVIPRIPPEPETEDDALKIWKEYDEGSFKVATQEEMNLIDEIRALRREGNVAGKKIEEMRAFIARNMKSYQMLVTPNGQMLAKFNKGGKRLKNSLLKELYPKAYNACLVEGDKSLRIIGAKENDY